MLSKLIVVIISWYESQIIILYDKVWQNPAIVNIMRMVCVTSMVCVAAKESGLEFVKSDDFTGEIAFTGVYCLN